MLKVMIQSLFRCFFLNRWTFVFINLTSAVDIRTNVKNFETIGGVPGFLITIGMKYQEFWARLEKVLPLPDIQTIRSLPM